MATTPSLQMYNVRIPSAQITGASITQNYYVDRSKGLVVSSSGAAIDVRFALLNTANLILPTQDEMWDFSMFRSVKVSLSSGGVTTTGTCTLAFNETMDPNLGVAGYPPSAPFNTNRLSVGQMVTGNIINAAISVDGYLEMGVAVATAPGQALVATGTKGYPTLPARGFMTLQFATAAPTVSGDWVLTVIGVP